MWKFILYSISILCFFSCKEEHVYAPKPRMYPRIDYPQKVYQSIENESCPFKFEIPEYAEVITDVKYFNEEVIHPCWFDIKFPDFNGVLHFSYSDVTKTNPIEKLVNDAFKLAAKHNSKAEYREELKIDNPQGVQGVKFIIEGPVASPINFYMTDNSKKFVRASLYFDTAIVEDSIAPVLNFIDKDINRMIETFRWK